VEREKRGDEMSKEQCRFCGNEATSEMDIAFQEDVQKAPVCAWHADFFRWMHSVLGQSVQKRMEIHNIPGGKNR